MVSTSLVVARKVLFVASTAPGPCLTGVARLAREHGWHLSTEAMQLGALPRGWQGDGVLMLLPCEAMRVAPLAAAGIPCVAFGDTETPAPGPRLESDHREIGRMAADHFAGRSSRSFAWAPSDNDSANHECLAGFESRLAEHGCTCRALPAYAHGGSRGRRSWVQYRKNLAAALQRLPLPAAIFAFNDCVAAEIIDLCLDAGFAVPGDIAVLGVGDSIACSVSRVPLSSIDPGLEEIGYRAAATLASLMAGQEAASTVTRVPPKGVVIRTSTDPVAVQDPRVARALSYIAENYPDSLLSVSTVASAVGMSRRNLERSFREATGGTIHDHIIDVRMREASRLLKAHPQTRTSEIAALVGLAGERTFFRAFRRHFGTSPGVHRSWAVEAWAASQVPEGHHPPGRVGVEPPPTGARPTAA